MFIEYCNTARVLNQFPWLWNVKKRWRVWGVLDPDIINVRRVDQVNQCVTKELALLGLLGLSTHNTISPNARVWIYLIEENAIGNFGGLQEVCAIERVEGKTWIEQIFACINRYSKKVKVMNIAYTYDDTESGGKVFFVFRPPKGVEHLGGFLDCRLQALHSIKH